DAKAVEKEALKKEINFRYIDDKHIGISLDETTSIADVEDIVNVLHQHPERPPLRLPLTDRKFAGPLRWCALHRTSRTRYSTRIIPNTKCSGTSNDWRTRTSPWFTR